MEGSGPQVRNLARLLKGIITLCYYELPAAQADIGYDPVPYVAEVAQRRLERYGDDVRRGEAKSLGMRNVEFGMRNNTEADIPHSRRRPVGLTEATTFRRT